MDVIEWLRSLGLEQYAPAFEQNHISPELLPSVTADDLKELGIASVGHRRAMLEALADLCARPAAAAEVSVPEPAAGSTAERRQQAGRIDRQALPGSRGDDRPRRCRVPLDHRRSGSAEARD